MNPLEEIPAPETAPFSDDADTQLQRWLAIAQQVKDSITIVLMLSTGMLIFGVLFGIAIPGLVLYFRRWRLVPEGASQERSGWHWVLTLMHELLWAAVFGASQQPADDFIVDHLELGYGLGALISLFALLNAYWNTPATRQ